MVATTRLCDKLARKLALPENVVTVAGIESDLSSGIFDPACMSINQVRLAPENVPSASVFLLSLKCPKSGMRQKEDETAMMKYRFINVETR